MLTWSSWTKYITQANKPDYHFVQKNILSKMFSKSIFQLALFGQPKNISQTIRVKQYFLRIVTL